MTDSKPVRGGAEGESGVILLREEGKDGGSAVLIGARVSYASPLEGAANC